MNTNPNTVRTSRTGIKHKPFDLAAALAGRPVVHLKEGKRVKGISHFNDASPEHRVVGLIDGERTPRTWTEDGEFAPGTGAILGMALDERTVYVPVSDSAGQPGRLFLVNDYPYLTREAAEREHPGFPIAELKYTV